MAKISVLILLIHFIKNWLCTTKSCSLFWFRKKQSFIWFKNQEKTDDELWEALDIAQAKNFVSNLPNQLDATIAEGGTNLSGGQKQRLSIARALVRKPEILIFDDSFSALDYKTDKELRKQIATQLKGTTCIIVAQRIGTIRNADQILVLDDGQIVGHGKHEELLKTCSVYQEIALSQLSKEELEKGGDAYAAHETKSEWKSKR